MPAACLCALWGYAATGLVGTQSRLHAEAHRTSSVARPAQSVLSGLQNERRLTAVWQASRTNANRKALDEARRATDAAVRDYRGRSHPGGVNSTLAASATSLNNALVFLPERRNAIDASALSATGAFQYFTDTISQGVTLLTAAVRSDDGTLARGGTAVSSAEQITEMLSREDALMAGALSVHRWSGATRTLFTEYAGVQQQLRTGLTASDLPGGGAATYGRITGSAQFTTVGRVEDAVAGGQGPSVPSVAAAWPTAADQVTGDLQRLSADGLGGLADSASSRGDDALVRLLLGTAGTLAAVAAAVLIALRRGRASRRDEQAILSRLTELQARADELSGVRVPQLLARIQRGEQVAPVALVPQGRQATDEVERLAAAIDQLGHVAAESLVQQSKGREGTEKVFAQLTRRTQTLIGRLISLLDDLERKHEDSDLLKDLFQIDHLATRLRRHAENLVILSGAPSNPRITAPVSIVDVMRSAVAETEKYTRVKVKNLPAEWHLGLAGRAVADVTHLLAELIENGTNFAPPDTHVSVSATKALGGLLVHVEDHGLGMAPEALDRANELFTNPPQLNMTTLSEDPRLGHFVVARLAQRHKIKVELRRSVYGTLAVVLLPSELLEQVGSPVLDQLRASAATGGAIAAEEARPQVAASVADGVRDLAAAAPAEPQSVTHTRLLDYSGFPEYGGAGLLPPASDDPSAPPSAAAPSGPPEWARAQGHPVPQDYPSREAAGAGPLGGAVSGAMGGTAGGPVGGMPQQGYGAAAQAEYGRQAAQGVQVPQAVPGYPGAQGAMGQGQPAPVRPSAAGGPGSGAGGGAPTRDPHQPLTTPAKLPQRTRGASLARQLRMEAGQAEGGSAGDGDDGLISPVASARAFSAIQQGLQRAQSSRADQPEAGGRQPESGGPGANQP
ncbi:nitrate- and nitrite sensing domain-containing protein [Streptomyces sp. HPF1205]|uniref:sensor histidine kinase n=1 Tax=Streptomyces sp. HPF1205 TaxID=2873262 RepID=UPI001CED08A3|nr:nitrate- and nitrite sensing domain-containing protein [Streptomyces sp. HPF1205]